MYTSRYKLLAVDITILLALGLIALFWFKPYSHKVAPDSPHARKLIYARVRKTGPMDGDVTLTSYEATGNVLTLHLNGTVVDYEDSLTAPWSVAWAVLPVVFRHTTAEKVILYWKDYLVVTYDRDSFRNRKQFPLAHFGDRQKQSLWFLRDAQSYKWLDSGIWDEATGEDSCFTKEEIPLSKGY